METRSIELTDEFWGSLSLAEQAATKRATAAFLREHYERYSHAWNAALALEVLERIRAIEEEARVLEEQLDAALKRAVLEGADVMPLSAEEEGGAVEDDGMETCRICGGSGVETIWLEDDWGDMTESVEKPCDVCGGEGEVDAIQAAERRACYGPEYTW